MPKHVPPGE